MLHLISLLFSWNYGEIRIEKYVVKKVIRYDFGAKVHMNLISDSTVAPSNLDIRVGPFQAVDLENEVGYARWVKIRRGLFGWHFEDFRYY